MGLKVQLLAEGAIAPTVANPGEDLGFDLYALEDVILHPGRRVAVRTGVAAVYEQGGNGFETPHAYGLLIRDRSSKAYKNGVTTSAGVIDAGYRGEILVIMTLESGSLELVQISGTDDQGHFWTDNARGHKIKAGEKIAQMIPIPVLTSEPVVVVGQTVDQKTATLLPQSGRGANGFGSSGR